jgi:penicillin-binding protein 1C
MKKIMSKIEDAFLNIFLIISLSYIAFKLFFMISLLIFPLPARINDRFSKTYYYNDGSVCYISMNEEHQYRIFNGLDEISGYVKKGIVGYEDRYFYFHPGFNPASLFRALSINLASGRVLSGGSTITMQVARLIEPKKRNIFNKLTEIFRSMQIETSYDKDSILEIYLNLIPMGGNIQGIGAASYFYFGKNPAELSFAESCLLISISNSPNKNRPDRFPENALASRNKVAGRIGREFGISSGELSGILQTSALPVRKIAFHSDILPLVERFSNLPYKHKRVFTIDRRLQEMSLGILKKKMVSGNSFNGAVMVIDNASMDVLSYVGSPFYDSSGPGVKFNACNIRRSPGSTLKPFIYARALELGLITPKMMIPDIPKDFSGYKPSNFTNNYFGVIPCDEALYRSLNIPAIQVEGRLGDNGIRSVLGKAGLYAFSDADRDDLSIVLGSYPLTMENMIELYSSLANGGVYRKAAFFKDESPGRGTNLLSPESCFIISEILAESYRPDLNASWEFTKDKPKVAYKTGTSYGYVDAWAVGYTPKYTIAVWIGNLDNRFVRMLTGVGDASPALFSIMDELCRYDDRWFKKPDNVGQRQVCSVSGMIPGNFCKHTVGEYYIKGRSPGGICNVHKRVLVDRKTGRMVAMGDISGKGDYEERIIEVWPDEVEYFLKKYGKKSGDIAGDYSDIAADNPLKIVSPSEKITYVVDLKNDAANQKITLAAYGFPDSKHFYWYANGGFLGSSKTDEPFYYLPEGKNVEISVIDGAGRTGTVNINVRFKK